MKLSTAIRIGSMTTRQIKNKLTDYNNGRCALGAIADASNISMDLVGGFGRGLVSTYPLLGEVFRNPIDGELHKLRFSIVRLNDTFNWTREQIADWVETIENDLEKQETKIESKEVVQCV